MSEITSHRDLHAWQRAVEMGIAIYKASAALPQSERFGLTSQLRRGAVSVASNIAEGYGRGTSQDYLRFLRVARGALFEVDTQLVLAERLEYLSGTQCQSLQQSVQACGQVLSGLIRSIERKIEETGGPG
ncbi:MAG: four helix bundle protein [Planctomycetes bacterium]|nr:four helix bundle protein [Planctomycetota bacterium]